MVAVESKRVRNFRLRIAKEIPKFPNDKASLQALQAKSLGSLLIDYANWAIRYIAPRPRTIVVEGTASSDPRWSSQAGAIQSLLLKIEKGEDLTPFLSLQPHTRGFTPAASAQGANVDRWADKDMLLNVTGYHHLHLDAAPSNQMRSNDMLFAFVTRDTCTIMGLFDHQVFQQTAPTATMTAERERLWTIYDERLTRGIAPGSVVISSAIASSGHSIYFVKMAMDYARVVKEIDPKLDDPAYVRGLYEAAGISVPKRSILNWSLYFLDLVLHEESNNIYFIIRKGPN